MKQLEKIIPVDELFWLLKFGKSKRKCNIYDLRADNFKGIEKPVFFLSTGRCGTKWFSTLISFDRNVRVLHNPIPNLGSQGKLAYEIFVNNNWDVEEDRMLGPVNTLRTPFVRYLPVPQEMLNKPAIPPLSIDWLHKKVPFSPSNTQSE